MTAVVVPTGGRVVPGDVVYSADDCEQVVVGDGCRVVFAAGADLSDVTGARRVVATRLGVVQWSGAVVSVYCPRKRRCDSMAVAMVPNETGDAEGPQCSPRNLASVFGPQLGDTVHMRVLRVSRTFAFGEIIAINSVWCSNSSASVGVAGAFRGVVRVEDIRPFKPTKDQLTPPPPAAAFQAGDVIVATVLSQSDARQYQLSTISEHCGVVEAFVTTDRVRVKLQHIPGRRDAMRNPMDATVHYRWCPLITADFV